MKILTNENNTSTLKLLIAANLAGKKVELQNVSFEGMFAGPRSLPLLQVDDQLAFFSSNAAAQYLFPVLDMSQDGQSQQMQEWEATRLQPAVAAVLSAKTVAADLRQALEAQLQHVEALIADKKYLFGDMLSAADISLWSTLYPLYHTDLKTYLAPHVNTLRWYSDIAQAKAVQEAVKQWGGSVAKPFAPTSALGAPQLASLASPVGTPMDVPAVVPGPTAEEIEAAKDSWINGLSRLQPPLIQEKFAMPLKDRKNVLITSSLPYVNNVPHLGNIIGCVLSGDIFARYCRLRDYNTLYICGTDEYGTATETKALQEGVTPKEICDKYYDIHNAVYRWFDIGFDHFGRTSTPDHTRIVQKLFLQVKENGFISSQTVDQLHCETCVKFLADRFVEGTCPHPGCLYEDARGDQCDKCGKLVNAIDLINPRCKICGNKPAVRPSEQLFIELGQLEPALRSWCSKVESGWSPSARAVARSWLREPLRARAVTRDLKWGVPVPVERFTNKVFYVWFDAPLGYWSITQCLTKDYEKWWKPDKDVQVKLYQFMAKDNVPFHAIMFPTAILAANQGHVLVDHIFATEYLNYEEGKFSKSRGVGVFGTDAQETGIPSDVWRFYLASVRPESSDSSFSWVELGTRNNSELLNNLGNFCHRSLSFCANSFDGKVPELKATTADYELMALVNREIVAYVQHMEKGRLREALKHVLLISKLGNQHMQASQPWVLLKGTDDDKARGATAVALCCQLVALLGALLAPYAPAAARRLRRQLRAAPHALRLAQNPSFIQYLPTGHQIGTPEPLFTKIEPEVLEKLKAKYAGTQDDREKKQNGDVTSKSVSCSVAELEKAVAEQGEKVRQLKAATKDKAAWAPEVSRLLELKKLLTAAQAQATPTSAPDVANLEKAVAEQGDKVRQLKASTKDKSVWAPEVSRLLQLKKQLAAAQATPTSVPDVAHTGSQSSSSVRLVTRKYLFDRLCSFELANIEEKLNFLKDDILSGDIYHEDQIASFKRRFAHFKSEIKRRWFKAHKKEDLFRKCNDLWLQGTFELPVLTQTKRGRPCKLFEESSERSKRRKTEEVRSTLEGEVIVHAAQTELQKTGKRDASAVLKEIVSSPTRATKYKKAFEETRKAEADSLTPIQALQMFVDADLTRRQYELIRNTNKKFFPCYTLLQKAKQECYPPPDECKVTSTSAESSLQSLVDLTVRRLSIYLEDVLITLQEQERESLKLICKWGCDGSQQSQFKQKFESDADSDASIFQSCFVPLRLVCGKDDKKIVWENPKPSSPRFCRLIRFRFVKESTDITEQEIDHVKTAANLLTTTEVVLNNNKFMVKHVFIMTMVDGKVCNAATGTKSTSRCYICGATSKDFNKIDLNKDISFEAIEFGLSVLHARIRIFESILHLAYKLHVKKYRARKTEAEKNTEREAKLKIQKLFREKNGLLVDMPKANFGNTNDGNTSRRFFENPKLASEITGIDYNLIYRLKIILEVISSGYPVDPEKYDKYALDTARLYVDLYNWHPMTPTMHKILVHGSVIIKNALLPIGQLSEEAAEARNKHFRTYRRDYARKFSRESCNRDIFNRLLLSSDPLLSSSSSMRGMKKNKNESFSPETIAMLISATPNLED